MKQYKGEISDFPFEVVEKMLDYQVEQGNPRDVSVFEKEAAAGAYEKGFVWENTEWRGSFWHNIINGKNFDLFFQKYPRKLIFEKDTAYQAETEEEAKMLLKEAHRQDYKWIDGELYINQTHWYHQYTAYNILNGCTDSINQYEKRGVKIVTVKEFFNLTNKTMTRFPFKLKEEQARKIISVACSSWKTNLAEKWGTSLLLDGYVEISESFYKEMRKACTKKQNLLFDEIFGVDKVEIDFSILNDKDVFYLETTKNSRYLFVGSDPFHTKVKIYVLMTLGEEGRRTGKRDCFDKICDKRDVTILRKADLGEQELYHKHYPQWSLKDAKDGEPVWVSETGGVWMLRYADGQDAVYCDQRKNGMVMSKEGFKFIKKFDPNNLPVNK